MTTLNEQLIATDMFWHVTYHPTLETRDEGDEFDYTGAEKHWSCTIVMDTETEASGWGNNEDEAKTAALADYGNKWN